MLLDIKPYEGVREKRFLAIFDDFRPVPFGQRDPVKGTYLDHHSTVLRNAYIARHEPREDWTNPYLPGTLSRYILWEYRDLEQAKREYNKRFFKP